MCVYVGCYTVWCQWCFRWLYWETWRSWLVGSASPSFISSVVSLETSPLPCSCPTELRWVVYVTRATKNEASTNFGCLHALFLVSWSGLQAGTWWIHIHTTFFFAMESRFNSVTQELTCTYAHILRVKFTHVVLIAELVKCHVMLNDTLSFEIDLWYWPVLIQNPLKFLKLIKDPMIFPAVVVNPLLPFI